MEILEMTPPKFLGKCDVCSRPVYADDYQHVQGLYFCGANEPCLTEYIGAKDVHVEG